MLKDNSKRQPYFQLNKTSKKNRRKEINKFLEHLGVDKYNFISKIHPPQNIPSIDIENKYLRILFEILASKDAKGSIDYYEVIKIINSKGIKFNQLNKVKKDGEKLPLTSQMFTNISNEHTIRSERTGKNGREISEETKELVKKFYLSNEISRVSPNKTRVIKRRSKNNPFSIVDSIYYRQFPINEIYKKFLLKYPQIKISKSSFFGLKPLNCKKPKSNQDVCPICKEAKKHLNRIKGKDANLLTSDERKALEGYRFHNKIKDERYLDYI